MRRRRLIGLAVALLLLANAGCVMLAATAVGGGAFGLAYVNGKVTEAFDASLDATSTAVFSALQDLALPMEGKDLGPAHAEIDSRTGTGRQIQIDLDAIAPTIPADPPQTKVGIRVVAFGDEELSRLLFDQIQHRLRNPAPVNANLPAPPFTPPADKAATPPSPPLSPPSSPQTDEPPLAK